VTRNDRRVAIITGGSQGIGAGLVAGYRGHGLGLDVLISLPKPPPKRR
jgi:NAD(P)-dependent dehydrogenase (short-subunit alcohol dehydrogenase family)